MKSRLCLSYVLTGIYSVLIALNYTIFVFPNGFAPSGIDGICTMIQDITSVNMGYLAFLANIPLAILALVFLKDRHFVYKSILSVIVFSITMLIFKHIGISEYGYHTESGASIVLAPVVSGVIRGTLYVLMLKEKSSGGGIDIIAAIIKRFKPYYNMMDILFLINTIIAFASYFVYDFKIEPVICTMIYSLLTTATGNWIRKSRGEGVKFEIITPSADDLCKDITEKLNFSATVMPVRGGYTGTQKEMVVCVVKKKGAPLIEDLLHTHTGAVVFESIVNNSVTEEEYRF